MKLYILLGLLPACSIALDVFSVSLAAKEASHLYEIVSRHADLDYGCRAVVLRSENEHKLHAVVNSEQYGRLKRTLDPGTIRIDMLSNLPKRQTETAPIDKGDRFQGGKIAPRGLGVRKPTESFDLGGILNVQEVHSALKGLENEYKSFDTFTTPYKTYEGQSIYGAAVSMAEKCQKDKMHIYLTSGFHARERGGPDNLIYFISDLLYANEHRIGLTYRNVTYTNSQVKIALGTGIVFIPMLNPDGVRYDQANNNRWRKNRNPASAISGDPATVGIDLNRNFDFLWNFTKHFDPSVEPASTDPASAAFYGTGPFSEPETQNMKSVYDEYPNIRWYMDVHSAAGTRLYSWGDDINQSVDKAQNLFNPEYDGKRGIVEDSLYKEYIDEQDWHNVALQANMTANAMMAASTPRSKLWHKDKKANKVYGYTMEFGYPENFYPTAEEFVQNIIDTNAGFMEFCLTADEIGLTG
ncbi:Zn-dependent exopeptidase [Pleomassaria siparia CBS 279.74]|uniref:Zn-dependent exopeptidase n=1 Tax=Pleomassaria siparia CBS 279.74 TaxID=1314801 RepID=A0A6G1JZC0_9PLEO|nr:Zn-dependent exopeptidase [Pleomassaria siparia CBS 279.74]